MTVPLSVLVRIELDDAKLTSSTAAEPGMGEVAWSAATAYIVDDVVIRSATHRRYSCLVAGTNAGLPEATPLRWYDLGPTNRWAMLDGDTNTQTAAASPATVVLHPGHFNTAYWAGLDADLLTVTVKDTPGGSVLHTESIVLEGSAPSDYYEHFFDPFKPKRDALIAGLETFGDSEITSVLTSGSGTVKCGVIAVGDLKPLGRTLSGAKAKPKSYARVTTDADGVTKIKRGKKAGDMTCTALVDISEANTVNETIRDLMDVPCLVICNDLENYSALRTFGLLSGELSFDTTSKVTLSATVIGII